MAIWDLLFGKKVTIQFRDEAGNLVERKVSEAKFNELRDSGAISKARVAEVYVLDPNGNYTTTWEIGKDIPADTFEKAKDPQSGILNALTTYEGGKPKMHVCGKEHWLSVKGQFDAIEREGVDAMAETRRKHPELFR